MLGKRLIVPIIISVVVLSVVTGALWALGSSSGGRERFSSLELAPRDAALYVAINTEPTSSQWLAVNDVLETLNAKDPIRKAIDEALADFDLEFERDILPLAGDEAYFAITDVTSLENSEGFVLGFQLRDARRAEEILLDIAEQEGTEYKREEYEGVTIYKELGIDLDDDQLGDVAASDAALLSFVGKVPVIGASRGDIEAGIDVIAGRSPGADENQRLQEVRQRQKDDFLVWGYADVQSVVDDLESYINENNLTALEDFDSEQLFDALCSSTDRVSFVVTSKSDGFVVDLSVMQPPDADRPPGYGVRAFESGFAGEVPADTMALFAGYDLYNGAWLPLIETLEETAPASQQDMIQDGIDSVEEELGIDLEDDLFSLLTGEYAMAFNASRFGSDEPEFDILALLEVNDTAKMRNTMTKFEDFLEDGEIARVGASGREGVRIWSANEGIPEDIAWALRGDDLSIGYPESSVTGFLDGSAESLADTADWKRTQELLPDDSTSVFYISLARIIEEIRQIEDAGRNFEESTDGELTLDDLTPIRSIAMVTTAQEGGYGVHLAVLIKD